MSDIRRVSFGSGSTRVGRSAALLATAVGIGRFVYTPILPLMIAQAGLSAEASALVATANYAGYLLGACLTFLLPAVARSPGAMRSCLLVVVATLGLMAATTDLPLWILLRFLAGAATAIIFIYTVNSLHAGVRDIPGFTTGWAFAGVGAGIVLSGCGVFIVKAVGAWQEAWLVAAVLAVVLAGLGWSVPPARHVRTPAPAVKAKGPRWRFPLLVMSYSLEGVGYIIAGTFIVAAAGETVPPGLVGIVWIVVGSAALPSVMLWNRFAARSSSSTAYVCALLSQAVGMLVLSLVGGLVVATAASILFGGTFVAISTLALALGAEGESPRSVAILTAGYSVGQIGGPIFVAPMLSGGYQGALLVGAAIVLLATVVALPLIRRL